MTRKLVTIRRVDQVAKHPNADSLDLIRIGGWQVVAKLGEFKEGDFCVFFEIDSILPDVLQFKFLIDKQGKYYERGLGARLRTIKLRGSVSQGLALPLSSFPHFFTRVQHDVASHLDEDFTEAFGVYKYEPPKAGEPGALAGNAAGAWPAGFPKTDQERIENCYNEMLNLTIDGEPLDWIVEEKMEGSSITLFAEDGVFGVCSHNVNLKVDDSNLDNRFVKAALKNGWNLIAGLDGNWAFRGELVGPGIQGNIYNLTEDHILIFDIWDIDLQRYLTLDERNEVMNHCAQIGVNAEFVPCVDYVTALPSLDAIISGADGLSIVPGNIKREGLVYKSYKVVKDRFGRDYIPSFKAVSRDYLLSEK